MILNNIKSLLPYFLIIALYFFFINLETRKKEYKNRSIKIEDTIPDVKSSNYSKEQIRITIPVIPFEK